MGWTGETHHIHDYPHVSNNPAIGRVWECNCGRKFYVAEEHFKTVGYILSWKEVERG